MSKNVKGSDILNAVKSAASTQYNLAVPYADGTDANIREIGSIITSYQPRALEFYDTLIGMIGQQLIKSKYYKNRLEMWGGRDLARGETVQEIFIDLCKTHHYDANAAETTFAAREKPGVYTQFHTLNLRLFYKVSDSVPDLSRAFMSDDGVISFVEGLVKAMYKSAAYDLQLAYKYMVGRAVLDGHIKTVKIPEYNDPDNANEITRIIRETGLNFTNMSPLYTESGVRNNAEFEEQVLTMANAAAANVDVYSLARAYNLDYVKFMGNVLNLDTFNDVDSERLAEIFAGEPNFKPFTAEEKTLLSGIGAVLASRDFFMIFRKYFGPGAPFMNGQSLYTNQWLHVWEILSYSIFENAVAFVTTDSTVTSVTVNGAASVGKGTNSTYTATVATTGYASKDVTWSISGQEKTDTTINPKTGVLTVASDETATTLTVKATSDFDNTKNGTKSVTVPA